jgi:hypothetical protein
MDSHLASQFSYQSAIAMNKPSVTAETEIVKDKYHL